MATNMVSSTLLLESRHQRTPGMQHKTKSRACNVVTCQTSTTPRRPTILLQGRSEGRAGIVHTQLRSQGRAGVSRQVICRAGESPVDKAASELKDQVYKIAENIDDPLIREAAKEPVAFFGGLVAGLLKLDITAEPLQSWVTKTSEAAGVDESQLPNLGKASSAKVQDEDSTEISID